MQLLLPPLAAMLHAAQLMIRMIPLLLLPHAPLPLLLLLPLLMLLTPRVAAAAATGLRGNLRLCPLDESNYWQIAYASPPGQHPPPPTY